MGLRFADSGALKTPPLPETLKIPPLPETKEDEMHRPTIAYMDNGLPGSMPVRAGFCSRMLTNVPEAICLIEPIWPRTPRRASENSSQRVA